MIHLNMKVQTTQIISESFACPGQGESLFPSGHIIVQLGIIIRPQDGSLHMLAFEATRLPGHTKKHHLKQLLVSQDRIVPRLDVLLRLP